MGIGTLGCHCLLKQYRIAETIVCKPYNKIFQTPPPGNHSWLKQTGWILGIKCEPEMNFDNYQTIKISFSPSPPIFSHVVTPQLDQTKLCVCPNSVCTHLNFKNLIFFKRLHGLASLSLSPSVVTSFQGIYIPNLLKAADFNCCIIIRPVFICKIPSYTIKECRQG